MLNKVESILKFEKRRDLTMTTPCCNRSNRDGKFVSYVGYPNHYGYCHSCGKSILPPSIYEDEKGNKFYWNDDLKTFVDIFQINLTSQTNKTEDNKWNRIVKMYIDFSEVEKSMSIEKENNLINYLINTYGNEATTIAVNKYYVGTDNKGGTIFWYINEKMNVQKSKIVYYQQNGKRTNFFKIPYKNESGYFSCLFGEHLLIEDKPVVLVESEKTAIVASMKLPKYNWLSYGGINGLTDDKISPLIGKTVIIIPDFSEKAIQIAKNKIELMRKIGVNAKLYDMSCNLKDTQLKQDGYYNLDLEDILRKNMEV
jgi:hypothetical protein